MEEVIREFMQRKRSYPEVKGRVCTNPKGWERSRERQQRVYVMINRRASIEQITIPSMWPAFSMCQAPF